MPLTVPPAKNFPSPLIALPSFMQDEPREGRMQVPVEILWGTMGGTSKSVSFNLQQGSTLPVSQISTLKVDNSNCSADILIVFPDTGETIPVPAYAPLQVVPVFSNGLQFYVTAPYAGSADVTRMQLLNYRAAPVSVAQTGQAQRRCGIVYNITLATVTLDLLSGTGITKGTITGIDLMLSIKNAANTLISAQLMDGGGGTAFGSSSVYVGAGDPSANVPLIRQSDLSLSFVNTIALKIDATTVPGAGLAYVSANIYFTAPEG